ncbi:septum formation initiator family protein [Aerococcaceae bacterium DSM 111020]|nr:septum formation initiator family protein [Aerococcaceae bacterium DSM 111020]
MRRTTEHTENNHNRDGRATSLSPHFEWLTTQWHFKVIMVVLVIALGFAAYGFHSTHRRYHSHQQQIEVAQADYQQAQDRLEDLMEQKKVLSDPDYLSQIARRDYYYSKPGEIIFNIESDSQ